MNINKNNYEAYFLDYHEGNLTPQEVAELLLFVEQHPELKEELDSFENFSIEDYSSVTFENKEDLKKEITEANRDEYFIKAVENTLTPAEKSLLENYLQQHPHSLVDYNLFQKTKLVADATIVFEQKDAMKKALTPSVSLGKGNAGEALISLMEGVLSKEETSVLNKQIAGDALLQRELALYQQTKLKADTSIVFENKESLKRKEKKVIPLYYYIAIAASILLLFGLFFLNNSNKGQQFAAKKETPGNNQVANNVVQNTTTNTIIPKEKIVNNKLNGLSGLVVKKQNTTKNNSIVLPSANTPEIIKKEEQPTVAENKNPEPANNNLQPTIINNQEPIAENNQPVVKNEQPRTKSQEPTAKPTEFLSLKQIAVNKLKESTLDEKTLNEEKKAGRLKKFSGWDLAKVVAKGVSKLTGRDVKINPTYNENGDVTAYALAAGGFEMTRGSK